MPTNHEDVLEYWDDLRRQRADSAYVSYEKMEELAREGEVFPPPRRFHPFAAVSWRIYASTDGRTLKEGSFTNKENL